jgi:hypothetical protein
MKQFLPIIYTDELYLINILQSFVDQVATSPTYSSINAMSERNEVSLMLAKQGRFAVAAIFSHHLSVATTPLCGVPKGISESYCLCKCRCKQQKYVHHDEMMYSNYTSFFLNSTSFQINRLCMDLSLWLVENNPFTYSLSCWSREVYNQRVAVEENSNNPIVASFIADCISLCFIWAHLGILQLKYLYQEIKQGDRSTPNTHREGDTIMSGGSSVRKQHSRIQLPLLLQTAAFWDCLQVISATVTTILFSTMANMDKQDGIRRNVTTHVLLGTTKLINALNNLVSMVFVVENCITAVICEPSCTSGEKEDTLFSIALLLAHQMQQKKIREKCNSCIRQITGSILLKKIGKFAITSSTGLSSVLPAKALERRKDDVVYPIFSLRPDGCACTLISADVSDIRTTERDGKLSIHLVRLLSRLLISMLLAPKFAHYDLVKLPGQNNIFRPCSAVNSHLFSVGSDFALRVARSIISIVAPITSVLTNMVTANIEIGLTMTNLEKGDKTGSECTSVEWSALASALEDDTIREDWLCFAFFGEILTIFKCLIGEATKKVHDRDFAHGRKMSANFLLNIYWGRFLQILLPLLPIQLGSLCATLTRYSVVVP